MDIFGNNTFPWDDPGAGNPYLSDLGYLDAGIGYVAPTAAAVGTDGGLSGSVLANGATTATGKAGAGIFGALGRTLEGFLTGVGSGATELGAAMVGGLTRSAEQQDRDRLDTINEGRLFGFVGSDGVAGVSWANLLGIGLVVGLGALVVRQVARW